MLATGQTAAVTTALSLYALQPNPNFDLSALGSMCFAGLIVLIISSILSLCKNAIQPPPKKKKMTEGVDG